MRKFRLRVVLVELVALSLLASALGVSVLAGEEYQVTATIQSPEPRSNAYFGWATDVNGDFIVASDDWAYVEGLYQAGKVLIFNLDGNLKVTLQAPTPQLKGKFGRSVAISQDIVLVGEYWAEVDGYIKAGRAHIFDTEGNLLASLQSREPDAGAMFGTSVDFSGDTIVVSEPFADVEEHPFAGKVHLYDSDGNFQATLQSPEPLPDNGFGLSVAGSEGIIVVRECSATAEDMVRAGKAHIFDSDGDLLVTLQSPEPQYNARFSSSVAVSGDIVVVGECWAEVEGNSRVGIAHIFDTDGNLLASLQSPEPEASAMFGWSVDTSGDLILVGEPGADGGSKEEGRVYVFDPNGNLLATLNAPEPTQGAEFGNIVVVRGEIVVVGDFGETKAGMVHIFQPGAADFTSSGLTIDPSSVKAGGTVTVSVECSNEGSRSGSHTITLKIDGEIEDEKTVTLGPDESTTVSFEVSATEEGIYSVDVNGLSGSFEVKKAQTGIPGFPIESIIAGLTLVLLAQWLYHRRS